MNLSAYSSLCPLWFYPENLAPKLVRGLTALNCPCVLICTGMMPWFIGTFWLDSKHLRWQGFSFYFSSLLPLVRSPVLCKTFISTVCSLCCCIITSYILLLSCCCFHQILNPLSPTYIHFLIYNYGLPFVKPVFWFLTLLTHYKLHSLESQVQLTNCMLFGEESTVRSPQKCNHIGV